MSSEFASRLKIDKRVRQTYASLLDLPMTGAFRLIRQIECKEELPPKEQQSCWYEAYQVTNFGQSFSFRSKSHLRKGVGELLFDKGLLITNPVRAFAFLASIGNVPLESLTLQSDGVKFLAEFQPASSLTHVNAQIAEFAKEYRNGNHVYVRSLAP